MCTYRTRTKFRGINFHALAGSEFRGSIFLCGVIFVDTRCSRSEINFQLHSYTRNVKFIRISMHQNGAFYRCHWDTMYHGRMGGAWEPSLLYARKYNKPCMRRPCMCQETFMQSANLFLRVKTIAAIRSYW